MVPFAINHMSVPSLRWQDVLDLAKSLGCAGVEFRNDLGRPLFDGSSFRDVATRAEEMGLRVLGLSQIYPFNVWSDAMAAEVRALIKIAKAIGAETISLIPRNDGSGQGNGERQANLRIALREIRPLLEEAEMTALVEPLGFPRSSLRFKTEAVDAIEAVGGTDHFGIVHDTFHHFLAEEDQFFPQHTKLVHISGVTDHVVPADLLEDENRVLVDAKDRLGNIQQITALIDGGYTGPISVEAFAPSIHTLSDPEKSLAASFDFIRNSLKVNAF